MLNAGPTDAYRFNWNTPFMLSPHNPSIVWLGGNRLFKSYNRGDTWIASLTAAAPRRQGERPSKSGSKAASAAAKGKRGRK